MNGSVFQIYDDIKVPLGKMVRKKVNGQKRKEQTYKDRKKISKKEWNEDGSVKE